MNGKAADEYGRRMQRAAEYRAARDSNGGSGQEDSAGAASAVHAEEAARRKRKKVDDAARAEYLVRDAIARGEFDNLKYAGKPIPGLGEGHDPDWWVKGLIQRENLTGLGPKAILLRTEDAELNDRLDAQYSEKQVRDILEDFNTRVIDARRQLQGGPPVITKTRDADVEVERWRERRAAAAAAARPPEPEVAANRSWWQRIWRGTGQR